jgi:predicted amidohydrolase YtcJ
MTSLCISNAEIDGAHVDVLLDDGVITGVGHDLPADERVDAAGGALLPGLHDHHLHLLALAAALSSVDCSASLEGLASAPGDGWVRGTGYHETVSGPVDRHVLDAVIRDRPVRVQHRSGALWMLNTRALDLVRDALDESADVERDARGEPTGRLWRFDGRLRQALPIQAPDLGAVGGRLSAVGITGVTDATPDLDEAAIAQLAAARGDLPQHVTLLGSPTGVPLPGGFAEGPAKLLLRDHDLPVYDDLVRTIGLHHARGRAVAVHCVTRESLVLTLTALREAGALPGDRVEHAAVVPPDIVPLMRRLGVAAVTQPDFVRARRDSYLREVPAEDLPHLYPYARLLAAGIPTVASSDAPYGEHDPWRVIATAAGRDLGPDERVPAATALAGYLSGPRTPGGPGRRVAPGAPADLVLLHLPLAEALRTPSSVEVRQTWIAGAQAHPRSG